jgi:YVTN family beta-propeller protein
MARPTPSAPPATTTASPSPTAPPAVKHRPPAVPVLKPPSDARLLTLVHTIYGAISPKSVVAAPNGLVFAQNMMYRHTVTVYARDGRLRKTIPDAVDLAKFGVSGHPGTSNGAPVEAAFSPHGRYVYVSNYSMYGAGFGPEGSDACTPRSAAAKGVSPSFVYRIGVKSLRIDAVYQVGIVPKFLAVTPDNKYLLVSNWCSYSVSVVSLRTGREVKQVYIGPFPRGIAVTNDSRTAYIGVMGGTSLAVLDLRTLKVKRSIFVGKGPRQVLLGPRDTFLYVSLNGESSVLKVARRSGRIVGRAFTGRDPRSMALAPDGRTLYVVNYISNTVTEVRTSDMLTLQTLSTGHNPIGITYNPRRNRVWVAVYTGEILVFDAR